MRKPVPLSVLALMTALPVGCGQVPSSPPSPVQKGGDEAAQVLKSVNESVKSVGPLPPGASFNVIQTSAWKFRTVVDSSASTIVNNETVLLEFDGRKLTFELLKGKVLLEGKEVATLPTGTKEVEVRYLKGKLSITADGGPVLEPSAPQ